MRLRLGLPVAEDLPRRCFCNADLKQDWSHFYSCGQLKRSAITTRHDRIVQCLARLFRSAGAVVHVEQRVEGTTRQRPDLLIVTRSDLSLSTWQWFTPLHRARPSQRMLQ